jgi:hypothetical protein
MWQNFLAVNFRCFGGLLIQPLNRINLIAGKNNTGKTALLEAIHLHSYPQDCDLPFQISQLRGIEISLSAASESLVRWLFYDRKTETRIRFVSQDDKGIPRELQIAFGDAQHAHQQWPEVDSMIQGTLLESDWKSNRPRMIMRTERQGKSFFALAVFMPNGGIVSLSQKAPWEGPSSFLSSWRDEPDKDVIMFSNFETEKRQEEILPSLRLVEPRVKRLSIIVSDNKPAIHADIGLSRLVPVALMGEGIRRLLKILLLIASSGGGRVLIDEIENGFHYSVLKDMWKAIGHVARKANVQVFATTHSWECIQAAHHAFKEDGPYELAYHRLDRLDDRIVAKTFNEENLERVQYTDLEIR